MSKWIESQPMLDELKHEWCNKCNKICPYNNCKIYRVMQILARQKAIPHEEPAEMYREETCENKSHCYDYEHWHCIGCNGCKKGGAENDVQ